MNAVSELPLSDVCNIANGYAFKSSEFLPAGIPLLRISNISNERVSFDGGSVYLDEACFDKYESFIVNKGDVVIALSGATTGKYGIYLLDTPALLNQRIGIIRKGKSKDLDSKYFYFYLSELKSEILRQAQGAAQPNISTKDIGRMKIPLPPLAEQQKIAAILDAADSLRQKDQQLIDHYTTLSQSLFLEMFGDPVTNPMGWVFSKLKDVIEDKTINGFFAKKEYYGGSGTPIVWITDFINKIYVSTDELRKVNIKKEDISKYKLAYGDVLFCRSSLTVEGIGKCAIVPKSITEDILFECHIIKVRLGFEVIPEYFRYLSNTTYFRGEIMKKSKTSTMTTISQEGVTGISIPLPPIGLQNQFAERIQAIEAQKQQAQASLEKSNDLFNSLLQKAFKAELNG